MSDNPVYVTRERLLSMEAELKDLKGKGRKEIAQKIADARSHGDLSENADYDAAKHEQELLEIRISRIERSLARARVIEAADFPDDKVYILSRVKVRNNKTGKETKYLLVSEEEADFEQNKLSVQSPLGKSLLGTTVGNVIQLKAPAGIVEYVVLEIGK